MKERVKLIILDEKPYVVSGDEIKLGDEVIITVNGQYPSKVSCETQPVLDLIKNNQLKQNRAFKIFLHPEQVTFNNEELEKILENDGIFEIEIENNQIKYYI